MGSGAEAERLGVKVWLMSLISGDTQQNILSNLTTIMLAYGDTEFLVHECTRNSEAHW